MEKEALNQALTSNDDIIKRFAQDIGFMRKINGRDIIAETFSIIPQAHNIFSFCNNKCPPYKPYQHPVYFCEIENPPYEVKAYYIYTGSEHLPFNVLRYSRKANEEMIAYNRWARQKNASLPYDALPEFPEAWEGIRESCWQMSSDAIDAIDFTNLNTSPKYNRMSVSVYDTERDTDYLYSSDRRKNVLLTVEEYSFYFSSERGQDILDAKLFDTFHVHHSVRLKLYFPHYIYEVPNKNGTRDIVIVNQFDEPDDNITIIPNFPKNIATDWYVTHFVYRYSSDERSVSEVYERIIPEVKPCLSPFFSSKLTTPQICQLSDLINIEHIVFKAGMTDVINLYYNKSYIAIGFHEAEMTSAFQLVTTPLKCVKTLSLRNSETKARYANLQIFTLEEWTNIKLNYNATKQPLIGKLVVGTWTQHCPAWKFAEVSLRQLVA